MCIAGLSGRTKDGLCVVVSRTRDLKWYAFRQSAGSTYVEAVAANREMYEQSALLPQQQSWIDIGLLFPQGQ